MRLLLAAALILFALPAAAQAAGTTCSLSAGHNDATGRTYSGKFVWPTETLSVTVEFKADCNLVIRIPGRPPMTGDWSQMGDKMLMGTSDIEFLGATSPTGFSGQMVDKKDVVGQFALTAPARVPAAAQAAPPRANGCGTGDAGNPYIAGRRYYGTLAWAGGEPERLTLTFNADCSVTYVYDDESVGSAVWTQNGRAVTLKVNGGYAWYNGAIAGDRFGGTLKNENGKTGEFAFTLKP